MQLQTTGRSQSRMRRNKTGYFIATAITLIAATPFCALAQQEYSPALQGIVGLNTVPSARMNETGTIRAGVSTLDPYLHSFAGLQLSDRLYVGVRQSAEISNLNEDADRLYPGIDLKFKVLEETRSRPAIAIGLQSALGHKRMAGEYIALSKRYKDLDFTIGAGWGRFGSAGHIDNPLKSLSDHFGKARRLDGELANKPDDWFTGEKIGFFGGIEYFTPIKGLSLKADWGADRYEAERAAFNYEAPAPWAVSANYKPKPWIDMNLGIQGTEKIMGRLTLSTNPASWKWAEKDYEPARPMRPFRTSSASAQAMRLEASAGGHILHNIQSDQGRINAHMPLQPYLTTPFQLGRAYRAMVNHAGPQAEELNIIPTIHNLHGPSIRIMRSDLENALVYNHGSPEEIWQNTSFETANIRPNQTQPYRQAHGFFHEFIPELTLENQISLSEEDQGTLYRTSLIAGTKKMDFFGLITSAASMRLNIADNLDRLEDTRWPKLLPVRSNVADFAEDTFALETLYTSYTHSFTPNTHMALTTGFLEEMYAGFGGEVLYRPYNAKWALGAESWLSAKRDPGSFLHTGLNGDSLLTGHINGWYDLPENGLTLSAKAGRYLAEDIGGTIALTKRYQNGTKLGGFVSVTNEADIDIFGGTTHAYGGLQLSIPLGNLPYTPRGTKINIKALPFGRDTGQHLDNPLPLYELTQPFTYRHITENWQDVVR